MTSEYKCKKNNDVLNVLDRVMCVSNRLIVDVSAKNKIFPNMVYLPIFKCGRIYISRNSGR